MKRPLKLLSIEIVLLSANASAQQLNFTYDQAGNQTTRQWVCVNCRPGGTAAASWFKLVLAQASACAK
ncbi:MAG: hypothetical protein EOO42_24130 [Flavobacteriales bacterium]|nr:MAG: hypothetical protein EOO42_24130 [Flavobacteriales bacterium]